MNTIGEKIRIQRVTKNYTQEYMAFVLDISQAAYSKIERGETEINLRRLYAIAEIFEISAFELMPKPKYGSGVNQQFVAKTLYKIRKLWNTNLKKKKAEALLKFENDHSDISKLPS